MYSFTTPNATRLVVYNPCGTVDVLAEGSGTTTVDLVAHGPESDEVIEQSTVTCDESAGTSIVTITLPNQRMISRRRASVDVVVRAPEGSDVIVAATGSDRSVMSIARGSGDVRVRGTVRDVDVSLPSADVNVQTVTGALSIKTVSGDLDAGTISGSTKVRTVSGDVSINELQDEASITVVSGDVTISATRRFADVISVSGDVTLGDAHEGASVKSTSGDVVVRRAWNGAVRAATVSGDVTLGVPPGRGVSVDARSMSGDLSSEIDLSGDSDDAPSDGSKVRITAHSVSGDIEIQRASGA